MPPIDTLPQLFDALQASVPLAVIFIAGLVSLVGGILLIAATCKF